MSSYRRANKIAAPKFWLPYSELIAANSAEDFMQSFYQRFVDTAARYPDNIAVELQRTTPASDSSASSTSSATDVSYTYAELRQVADHLGAWLQGAGVPAGAKCAILAANSPR
ncbi:MAG: hypothetical protein DMG60_13710, partial [Acidobacteria bacterium]